MKRVTKISLALAVTLPLTAVAALLVFWPSPDERHFASPIPNSAKLLHYTRSPAGFDVSYVFVFQAADDKLLGQLIKEWSLKPAVAGQDEPISFVTLRPPAWWLNQNSLQAIPERYLWIDQGNERYRSVWVDRSTAKVYAEYGRW
ncbi:MAG TPA: hypothetical protein VF624_11485 [Tepidisphaeraceae bacterium]